MQHPQGTTVMPMGTSPAMWWNLPDNSGWRDWWNHWKFCDCSSPPVLYLNNSKNYVSDTALHGGKFRGAEMRVQRKRLTRIQQRPQAWHREWEHATHHGSWATGDCGHLEKPPSLWHPLASCSVMWKYSCISVISVVTKVSCNSSNYTQNVMASSFKKKIVWNWLFS